MDIRYIVWAGYDFLGPGVGSSPGKPYMDAELLGYDIRAEASPKVQVANIEIAPPSLRAFPKPDNTL